ncbi:MAG TPA: DUF4105 domain-containing protein [Gemmatimonadaceae bacterium]|nr:DUF4105 domain-containing protein [Gemmatimonadaceae bacterium]
MRLAPNPLARALTVASRYSLSALVAVFLVSVAGDNAVAQPAEPPPRAAAGSDAQVPGSQLTIYLMTMGPGDAIWEKFGHNAIWIHDKAKNTDVAYNWGLFDFAASDFMSRFLRGDMRYWMGGMDLESTVDFYRRSNRWVIAQELNLTPAQRTALARFVEWNALPENRFYSYDYYLDNCSTRVRDVIDLALGGALRPQMETGLSGFTYRYETRRLMESDIPVYTGTMLGLGQPVDRRVTGWELAFLPGRLSEMLRDAEVRDGTGKLVHLILSEDTLFAATREPEPRGAGRSAVDFLPMACLLFAILTGLAQAARARAGALRPVFLLVAGIASFAIGIAGTGLIALWTLTNHVHSYRNENVLQATPLSLILAVMILAHLRSGARRDANSPLVGRRTLQLAWIIVALSGIGLVMKILPGFYQENHEIIALLLPTHLGLALALAGGDIVPARFRRRRSAVAAS